MSKVWFHINLEQIVAVTVSANGASNYTVGNFDFVVQQRATVTVVVELTLQGLQK